MLDRNYFRNNRNFVFSSHFSQQQKQIFSMFLTEIRNTRLQPYCTTDPKEKYLDFFKTVPWPQKLVLKLSRHLQGILGAMKLAGMYLGRVTDDGENGDLIYPQSIVQIAAVLRPLLRPPLRPPTSKLKQLCKRHTMSFTCDRRGHTFKYIVCALQ